jgi:xanthine dehydrogenase/oxidase
VYIYFIQIYFYDKYLSIENVLGNRISLQNPSQSKTLLEYLRTDLGLTGTKLSCGESGCGSCTVTCTFLDQTILRVLNTNTQDVINEDEPRETHQLCHRAINACTTKLISLHGMAITTIEGLGSVSKVDDLS